MFILKFTNKERFGKKLVKSRKRFETVERNETLKTGTKRSLYIREKFRGHTLPRGREGKREREAFVTSCTLITDRINS